MILTPPYLSLDSILLGENLNQNLSWGEIFYFLNGIQIIIKYKYIWIRNMGGWIMKYVYTGIFFTKNENGGKPETEWR